MNDKEILEYLAALGHDMKPDHCTVVRFTCAHRVCGQAALNAGGGWYGRATEATRCSGEVVAVEKA